MSEAAENTKLSPAAQLPEGWTLSTVGEEFDVQLGKMLDAAKNTGEPKPYLGNRSVRWGRLDLSELPTVPLTSEEVNRFRLRKGDLLVCEGGEVGRSALWNDDLQECYYQKALHRLRPRRGFDPQLMLAFLRDWANRGKYSDYVTQTSIAHLPREKFVQMPLLVPPRAEQRAIASGLADVDALISRIDDLIAKKRDLKQAAMQQLLTGTKRLPGFGEPWVAKTLYELAEICGGSTPSTTNPAYWNGEISWCTPTDISALGGAKYVSSTTRSITSAGLNACAADLLPPGSVIMTSRATIGECAINQVPMATNQGFKNFLPRRGVSGEFLYYLLQTRRVDFIGLCSGSTFLEIGKSQLARFEVTVPDEDEQQAIARVLSDLDDELSEFALRRDKIASLKQGMMQQLLTGKIRLV